MKIKIYTLTTLCLFFMLKISAQDISSVYEIQNQINLTLLVKDGDSGQVFHLLSEDNHKVSHEIDMIKYYITLDYQSTENTTSYFALRCEFDEINDASIGNSSILPTMTATAPVIIPPVKKKKTRLTSEYPHMATILYRLHPRKYEVTIQLLKFKTYQDYIAGNDNYSISTTKVIYIDATHTVSSESAATFVTYPNPTINTLTITYPNTTSENTPLEVTIFNDKGMKVSQHSVTDIALTTLNTSYNLDTSHLPNGTYYFQFLQGGKTQIKTIIKQ